MAHLSSGTAQKALCRLLPSESTIQNMHNSLETCSWSWWKSLRLFSQVQVYVNGEFFGGCDIMIEGYQSGELKETLEAALLS